MQIGSMQKKNHLAFCSCKGSSSFWGILKITSIVSFHPFSVVLCLICVFCIFCKSHHQAADLFDSCFKGPSCGHTQRAQYRMWVAAVVVVVSTRKPWVRWLMRMRRTSPIGGPAMQKSLKVVSDSRGGVGVMNISFRFLYRWYLVHNHPNGSMYGLYTRYILTSRGLYYY